MECPKCGSLKSRVYETVTKPEAVYRYRWCAVCHKTLKTKEVLFEGTIPQKKKKSRKKVEDVIVRVTSTDVFSIWK
jgi:transcriptional regulator NrdR family protein